MKKNVWEMTPDEICIIKDKKYRWTRDFKKKMPRIGTCLNREIVNIEDDDDTLLFLRNVNVEIFDKTPTT